jgi:hypothetical protein
MSEMSQSQVTWTLTIDELSGVPGELKRAVLNEVGEYLVTSVLDYVAESRSPVSGGKFKAKLSKDYAEREGKDTANLDLTGSMLDSLTYRIRGNSVEIGVFDSDEAPKAYNHNVGDTLPQRQFIPMEDQNFKSEIMAGIDEVIEEILSGGV